MTLVCIEYSSILLYIRMYVCTYVDTFIHMWIKHLNRIDWDSCKVEGDLLHMGYRTPTYIAKQVV